MASRVEKWKHDALSKYTITTKASNYYPVSHMWRRVTFSLLIQRLPKQTAQLCITPMNYMLQNVTLWRCAVTKVHKCSWLKPFHMIDTSEMFPITATFIGNTAL